MLLCLGRGELPSSTRGLDGEGSSPSYPKTGIYHYSNLGVSSWYDFTQMIQHTANTLSAEQRHCNIRPCLSSQYPSPVKRPSYSVLDKTKIQETFGLDIPYWTDSLRQCIANLIRTENS